MILARTAVAISLLIAFGGPDKGIADSNGRPDEIKAFNSRFVELISKSDHDGMLALWAEDGVDLMPGEAPIVGKTAIAKWLKDIESHAPDSVVTKEELEFHDIQVSGQWASEWATEHQIVQPPGKLSIEEYGKIALILHREESGRWKIKQEMWNDSPRP
jgi:uncharacterized protein (TIGR02246 family)